MAKAKDVEKAVFEPALKNVVDAGIFSAAVAGTMLWNGLQKDKIVAWALGELLVSLLIIGGLKEGRVRDLVFGVEAGAIATLVAPALGVAQKGGATGAKISPYRVGYATSPAVAVRPVSQGVNILDI